jgi:ubiquinol-cytochrome c reductase cytochrome c subunit
VPRAPRILLALALGAVSLVGIAAPSADSASTGTLPAGVTPSPEASAGGAPTTLPEAPNKSPIAPAPGDETKSYPTSPALVSEGQQLYAASCSSCHGIALRGTAGVAPSLIGVGAGPVDFYMSTGRMPLASPRTEPQRAPAQFKRSQINALIAYISKFGGPRAPAADPAKGSLALGLHEFTQNCAGCHQVVGRGGLTVNVVVPDLQKATPLQIAEAVRMGPYLMPHFDTTQINQHDLDSIARYVLWTRHPDDAGGWGIYNLGPIPEGIVAWFIGLVAMVIVARLIGERNDEGVSPTVLRSTPSNGG